MPLLPEHAGERRRETAASSTSSAFTKVLLRSNRKWLSCKAQEASTSTSQGQAYFLGCLIGPRQGFCIVHLPS